MIHIGHGPTFDITIIRSNGNVRENAEGTDVFPNFTLINRL
ncbi:MAG: hypothetical protein BWY27_01241 [Bacteroidetes bacterium ADurb.Bin234]|nr:MAG: hypothetical protein BWY27_01241 [Bacteroidetes bacterium ADurb.Bin234]